VSAWLQGVSNDFMIPVEHNKLAESLNWCSIRIKLFIL